ncbi:MAG: hypothetical protein ACRDD7_13750 [Peptostreptococcaceae bacterium]
MLYRVIMKYEFNNFYLGKDFQGKWYKIIKNKCTRKFQIGMDYNFYAANTRGIIFNTLLPITDEEAGVTPR